LLQRVIEERFVLSLGEGEILSDEVWEKYFAESVDGIPTKQYILERIIPRPRDIIYLCKEALIRAINHNHTRIDKEDIVLSQCSKVGQQDKIVA
jgi:hypothetical protein